MAEQTQQDGQKTIVAFVVGLLIGGMLVWAFSEPHTDRVDDMNPIAVEVTDDVANTKTETDSKTTPTGEVDVPTTPTLPVGDGEVRVMNQPASIEVALDEAEGADILMVKPAGPYLDIIREVREETELPLAAYQVSGEYALVKVGAAAGVGDHDALMMEKLIAFKRAGCSGILTYFAADAARLLHG